MLEYKMNINGKLKLSDYSSIYDYIDVVDKKGKVTININEEDIENFNIICNILKMKNLNICFKEKNILGKYCIIAFKE